MEEIVFEGAGGCEREKEEEEEEEEEEDLMDVNNTVESALIVFEGAGGWEEEEQGSEDQGINPLARPETLALTGDTDTTTLSAG